MNMTDDIVLVVGSQCANPADRTMDRSDIRSVQVVINGICHPLNQFNDLGEYGVSALAWPEDNPFCFYLTTGSDLIEYDLVTQTFQDHTVSGLHDVHEITCIGDQLWLANTAPNEAVCFDLKSKKVVERLSLIDITNNSMQASSRVGHANVVERFHCNQVFVDLDDNLFGLVHHIEGTQHMRRSASQFIKKQGNGGVLGLRDGFKQPLNLVAPHTVRVVNGQYWLCDSGNAQMKVFSAEWTLVSEFQTAGWGRGADLSSDGKRYFVGSSPIRKRYLTALKGVRIGNCVLEEFEVDNLQLNTSLEIDHIEQINNVYVISAEQDQYLRGN